MKYLTKKQLQKLREWLSDAQKCPDDNKHDLHIDVIFPRLAKNKEQWVNLSLNLLERAKSEQSQDSRYLVLLRIPLKESQEKIGFSSKKKTSFISQLSYSPPSLYLFKVDDPIIHQIISDSSNIDKDLFSSFTDIDDFLFMYSEVFDDKYSNEFIRDIYVK